MNQSVALVNDKFLLASSPRIADLQTITVLFLFDPAGRMDYLGSSSRWKSPQLAARMRWYTARGGKSGISLSRKWLLLSSNELMASSINHSCLNIVRCGFIGDLQLVHATRAISPDTELTLWHHIPIGGCYEETQRRLQGWGFSTRPPKIRPSSHEDLHDRGLTYEVADIRCPENRARST